MNDERNEEEFPPTILFLGVDTPPHVQPLQHSVGCGEGPHH